MAFLEKLLDNVHSQCTQSTHKCMSMQPGSQKEMQIDFDDDESPQQTEQGQSTMQDTVKQARIQVYLNHAKLRRILLHIAKFNANAQPVNLLLYPVLWRPPSIKFARCWPALLSCPHTHSCWQPQLID